LELEKSLNEINRTGAVEVQTAQDAIRLKRLAEAMGLSVGLIGHPGKWRVYDLKRAKGVG